MTAPVRKIIHVDMDAFYASIEQRDNPEYRGKPLAVGFSFERGVVAAASYEARKFGVRSAMPSVTAKRLCPSLIFVPARFEHYREVSMCIRRIFLLFTDLVEPLSLDEAYLDVTDNRFGASATAIAREIKRLVLKTTGLTASAGVSVNKFLAKVASDYDKPDGLFVIPPCDAEKFAEGLDIKQFWGVGRVTEERMRRIGINTGADLKKYGEAELTALFGKQGSTFYKNARGIDDRPVEPDRERKSIGAETTFLRDVGDKAELERLLAGISGEVWERLVKNSALGRTVTLKVKYEDFELITRRVTLGAPLSTLRELAETAARLLSPLDTERKKVRLLGISVSGFDNADARYRQRELDFGDFDQKT